MVSFIKHPEKDLWINLERVMCIYFVTYESLDEPYSLTFDDGTEEGGASFTFKTEEERLSFLQSLDVQKQKGSGDV